MNLLNMFSKGNATLKHFRADGARKFLLCGMRRQMVLKAIRVGKCSTTNVANTWLVTTVLSVVGLEFLLGEKTLRADVATE